MNKVLVTGASGLLGRAVVVEFSKHSWDVIGLAYTRANDKLIKVDLNNMEAVKEIVLRYKPIAIVHCAAERSPDKVEKDLENSRKLNVLCSKNLSTLSAEINAAFLYISSDYVFDGTSPPYKEMDKPNPLNQYGLTKYEGEMEVTAANPASCILRIPVLYGDEEYIGESAISSLIKNLANECPTQISDLEIRYPALASDVAGVCYDLIQCKLSDPSLSSVFHWCGSEPLSKYDMIKIIAEIFKVSHAHISPTNKPSKGSPRPQNTQLSCERLKNLGIRHFTSFHDGIYMCFKKFFEKSE